MSAVVTEHTNTIGEIQYTTKIFPSSDGLVIFPKLVSLLGEPILKLILSTDDDERREMLGTPAILAQILTTVAKEAVADDGLLVLRDLMITTKADKVRLSDKVEISDNVHKHFDTHFAARYMHLIEVAMWVAEVNFTES